MYSRGAVIIVVLISVCWAGCDRVAPTSEEPARVSTGGPYVQSTAQGAQEAGGTQLAGEEKQTGTPRIVFEQTEFDFGEVDAGVKVEHTFTFKNTGNGLLKIEKVRSS